MKPVFTILFVFFLIPFSGNSQASGLTEIYDIVEKMPRFPGCEHLAIPESEKVICAEKKMLEFLFSSISYPPKARENGVEGIVVVSFVVRKTGAITDIEIIKEIGNGCGDEVSRVISLMPDWVPGLQQGRPVNVRFNLPVSFRLENRTGKKKKRNY